MAQQMKNGLIDFSPVDSPHKGPVTRKLFPFDDVIIMCEYSREPVFLHKQSCYTKTKKATEC